MLGALVATTLSIYLTWLGLAWFNRHHPSTCDAPMHTYDHWKCQRKRPHLGRHRSNNYTSSRIPKVWRGRQLLRWWKGRQQAKKRYFEADKNLPSVFSVKRVLFPTRFDPLPVVPSVVETLNKAARSLRERAENGENQP